jgi:hypothetical protein
MNIESLTKGTAKMQEEYKDYKTFNEQLFFTLEDFNEHTFSLLSEKKQEKIKTSPEFQNLNNLVDDDTDSLPF